MTIQEIIVTIIVAIAVFAALRHYYRRFTGKISACDSCPKSGCESCHCKDK